MVCQKGGSSSGPLKEPEAGALPHGSSLGGSALREPPPPPPPLKPPPPPPPPPKAAPTAPTAPTGLVHLGRGVSQRRADLVDLELDDGPLLALTGLERT